MQRRRPESTELEATFNALADKWIKETAYHSNDYFIVNHPAYQQIIEMGEAALPLIFRELEKEGTAVHWPYALNAVTGADPTPPPRQLPAGFVALDIKAIHQAWLQWGQEQGYQW